MPRRPKDPEEGDGSLKFSVILEAEMVRELNAIAEEMRTADPLKRVPARGELVRGLISMGIAAYRSGKRK